MVLVLTPTLRLAVGSRFHDEFDAADFPWYLPVATEKEIHSDLQSSNNSPI
jgi:hypothetical protein